MEIGLFQLENIFSARTQFYFLDLRLNRTEALDPALDPLLKQAQAVSVDKVESYLKEKAVPKEYPVILLCEDGRSSEQAARRLEASGYQNVYTVARGVSGLLSDL